MKSSKFLAVAAFSALSAFASVAVHADEADKAAWSFNGNLTRAEVQAAAAQEARTYLADEYAAGAVAKPVPSTTTRAAVRAQARDALRTGQISQGEAGA